MSTKIAIFRSRRFERGTFFLKRRGLEPHRSGVARVSVRRRAKTVFMRGEACGAHACLHKLRASAAGDFGPPIPAGSNRSGYVRFTVLTAFIRTAACEGTRRLRSGPSPGRSCGPPMACAIAMLTHGNAICQFTAGERRLFERLDARFVLRCRGQRRTARADARSFDSVRSRAERLATQRSSPPPGGGCGLPHLRAIPESVVRGRSRVALPSVAGRRLRTRTAATDPARSAPKTRRSTRASSPAARRRRP